jgi:hypothetical protein
VLIGLVSDRKLQTLDEAGIEQPELFEGFEDADVAVGEQ